ncbi:MAG: dienelactone hydrolase family protein [Deltaproteobacteria bacterium]|nr:dienelactone hydrolase family protein [Deltaproteobacteria bacterium]
MGNARQILTAAAIGLAWLISATDARAAAIIKPISYHDGYRVCRGFIAYAPEAAYDIRPGILLVHQRLGPGDFEKVRARQLAELGYVVLVPDLYGQTGRPKNLADADRLVKRLLANRAPLRRNLKTALGELTKHPLTDPEQLAAIGIGFGGTAALELARDGADLDAVVMFHSPLTSNPPDDAKNIRAKILVLRGARDETVPDAQVDAFKAEMSAAGVDYRIVDFGGVGADFSIKTLSGDASFEKTYDAAADAGAWRATLEFLAAVFDRRVNVPHPLHPRRDYVPGAR